MDQREAQRRFEGGRVGRMATIRADRTPDLVPIVFAVDGNMIYSAVDPKPKTTRELLRLRNIRAEPRVQLLVDEYSEDWRRLWWVRAEGVAHVASTGPERDRAIELLRAKYPQYAELAGDFGPAIIVKVVRWTGWEFAARSPSPT